MKIFVALSILGLLFLLIQNKYRPSLLFAIVASLYYLLGFLNLNELLIGFTNNALMTLVLLLLVSITVEKTLIIDYCSKLIITQNYLFSLLKLGVITTATSAFLNNTAVVAAFMGMIKNNVYHLPSKLLIPLSYFAIVGGTITLVGTSTNLVVNSFVIESGLPSLQMFDFLLVGVCISIAVIIVMILISAWLPKNQNNIKKIDNYLIRIKVLPNSKLIGKSIQENGLRNLENLFLLEIERGMQIIAPASHSEIILGGDILIFSGDISQIDKIKKFDGLVVEFGNDFKELNLVDVVVTAQSNLIGKTIKEAGFRTKFDAAIVCFQRGAENIKKIGQEVVCAGDRLILAVGNDFKNRDNLSKNFYILSNIEKDSRFGKFKSLWVVCGFILLIIGSAMGFFSLLKGLLVFLAVLLLFRAVSFEEIRRRFPIDIFIIIGASLAITKVLVGSGLAQDLASFIIGTFGEFGIYGSFTGVYLLTLILTEIITNNAAAALAFPIAYSTAVALEVNPIPFIFAVAYGASCGFMMPFGYQTHLMVSSIGGYKLTDFVKVGWAISLTYSLVVILLVPLVFKF